MNSTLQLRSRTHSTSIWLLRSSCYVVLYNNLSMCSCIYIADVNGNLSQ